MCGRYGFTEPDKAREYYDLNEGLKDLKPRYNAAPGQQLPVVIKNSHNKMVIMKWGLVPFWAKDPNIGYKMINARSEGIKSKPAYRKAFKSQHCLIPASYFFEWDKISGSRTPYLIKLKDRKMFSLAGFYDIWLDTEKKQFYSFIIITTSPNKLIAKIHDRMPVILNKVEEQNWLDVKNSYSAKLLGSFPADKMEMYAVSTLVNKPVNDIKEVTRKRLE